MIKRLFLALFIVGTPLAAFTQAQGDSIKEYRHHSLDEVVVTGTRDETDIRHLPMTISVLNNQQIKSRYEQSLLPVISEQVPGVFVTSRGVLGYGVAAGSSGGIKIRGIGGSPTTGVLVLIDGHPQYMGLMGHSVADSYQSIMADKVEVVRGSASVLYGSNALGGVINIVSRKLQEDGGKTDARVSYGSYNTLMSELSMSNRKGRFSSILNVSYDRTDGHRDNMEYEQYSVYSKLGFQINENWNAFIHLNVSRFDASNPGSIAVPLIDNDSEISRGISSLSVENNCDLSSGAFKFFYNWGRHKINDGYQVGATPVTYLFNSKDMMSGLMWYQSVSLFSGNRLTAGIDVQKFGGEAWNSFYDGNLSDLADKSEEVVAGYITARQNINSVLTVDAGLRLDHHSTAGSEWIPQGGVSYQVSDLSLIRAIVSKGFRNPSLREMYMFPPQNPDLKAERLVNYEVSFSSKVFINKLSYSVSLFYIKGDNMIQTVSSGGRPLNLNSGEIENRGAELSVNYRANERWLLTANYSLLDMEKLVLAAPENKLYLGAVFKHENWHISSGIQYISGLYVNIHDLSQEEFLLLNIRGSFKLSRDVSLFVKGENLLAQEYEINEGYPMPKATFSGGFNISF